jgi:predicted PurR-regulated permease PerM
MSIFANIVWIVIVPIVAFYALRDFHTILAKGLLLVPPGHRDKVQTAVTEVTSIFARFLRGLAIVSFLNGVATAILLTVLGVPGGLLVGVIAGLLYSVPYIGALLTILLTAAVSFVGGGLGMMYWATGLSVLLHQVIFDQIVSPRILGAHVGLHPILSIVALLIGNLLLGIIGMIVAVPVAACVQMAVLALLPKLSHEIEIPAPGAEPADTVDSLSEEMTEAHQQIDASEQRHAAVTAAVESIEEAAEAASPSERPPDS